VIALARNCIRYRELLSAFIARELRARYRGSLLGGLWMILQPVVFLVVYYTVFIKILSFKMVAELPATMRSSLAPGVLELVEDPAMLPRLSALAMFVALIPWIAIAECIMRAATSVFENGNIIKKIAFPSELLAVNLVGYNIVNIAAGFVVFIGAEVIALGVWPSPTFLAFLPVVLFLQAVFMLGLSYLVSTGTVFVRDIIHLIPIATQVWMFLSPIFYFGLPKGGEQYEWMLRINPVYHLLVLYRAILIFTPASLEDFPWASLGILAAVAFAVAFAGYRLFIRFKADFADEL
jgi:homopolymeric O-antigen transport system permease protein